MLKLLALSIATLVAFAAPVASAFAPVGATADRPVAPVQSPPPGSDIYELAFDGTLAGLKNAKAQVVAAERGYDNQPHYARDGSVILFTANRDGKQTDIYEFDRSTRTSRRLVSTPEGEYSATFTPDGTGFSVIRVEADSTQRLWRFDRDGTNPRVLLATIRPVGYHAWIDGDQLALFVLGKPSTLQHARISTGTAKVVAESIGRSLHAIPATQTVSFVHRETPDAVWVKRFDPATGNIRPLVRLPAGNQENDVAWLPDGTLLRSAGTKIFAWHRGDKDWQEVADVQGQKLGAVTRMASAPDGKSIAIVVEEPKA
jgi:Tol biopolymer transport system component